MKEPSDLLKNSLIAETESVRRALETIGQASAATLFVVGENRRLRGVVTDGDLRRWILQGKSLAEPITRAMHANPIVVRMGYTNADARGRMLKHQVECLPVVNGVGRVVSLVRWMDLFEKKETPRVKTNTTVVIMAGGEGHRLAPLTRILPKPLVPIGDKPIIEHIMDRFRAYGTKDFFVSINYKARLIRAYFQEEGCAVTYIEEKKPLGTAGSLGYLRGKIDKTFWVSNCDILIEVDFSDVLRVHRADGNDVTLVGSMKHYTIPYGVCHLGANGALQGINEKPEYDFLVNTGVYVMEPAVLRHIVPGQHLHFTELVARLIAKGGKVGVYPVAETAWMDMGEVEELKKMGRRFGMSL